MHLRATYRRLLPYFISLALVVLIAAAFHLLRRVLDDTLVALLFLVPVGVITARWGLGPGISAALAAFLAFNYLFIAPYYTFTVHHPADLAVLLIFLAVAAVMSQLVARAQAGARAASAREREATQLYELSMALAGPRDGHRIVISLARQLQLSLDCQLVLVTLSVPEQASAQAPEGGQLPVRSPELVAPVQGLHGAMGEIRLWRAAPFSESDERLVKLFASQGALALERAALAQTEDRARLLEESDRLKSSLLSSVSHDLRTPLATIKAAASSLRSGEVSWDSPARLELVSAIDDEADHLNTLVGNLLDMSRIESGALRPQRRWNALNEIVQGVVGRLRRQAEGQRILVQVPEDLPLVPVDFVQLGQVFTNLISNSIRFAPLNSTVLVKAATQDDSHVLVQVSNQGPPVPEAHLIGIFDKFHRLPGSEGDTGTGLGLSICKGIIEAHGGTIWAENLSDGFAFKFILPLRMEGEIPQALPPEAP